MQKSKKNTFILSYMDYLVHHEFGLNLKTLKFKKNFSTKYKNTNINFWLAYWVYVYENVLKNYKPSKNIQFLAYEKFNTKLTLILKKFNLNFSFSEKNIFQNKNNLDNLKNLKFDNKLKIKANQIYRELKKL